MYFCSICCTYKTSICYFNILFLGECIFFDKLVNVTVTGEYRYTSQFHPESFDSHFFVVIILCNSSYNKLIIYTARLCTWWNIGLFVNRTSIGIMKFTENTQCAHYVFCMCSVLLYYEHGMSSYQTFKYWCLKSVGYSKNSDKCIWINSIFW